MKPKIGNAKNMSGEKLEAGRFFWPISREEIHAVLNLVIAGLVNLSKQLSNEGRSEARYLLYALTPTIQKEIISLYRMQAFFNRSTASDRSLLFQGRLFAALANEMAPSYPATLNILKSGPSRPQRLRTPARLLRGIVMPYLDSIVRYPLTRLDDSYDAITITVTPLIEANAGRVDHRVVYRGAHYWFDRVSELVNNKDDSRIIEHILDITRSAFHEGSEVLPTFLAKYQKEWLRFAFALSRTHLRNIEKKSVRLPKNLWTGSGLWIWARLLKPIVCERGGHITGHDHGTGAGYRNERYKAYREFEFCNRFITFGPGHVDGYKNCFASGVWSGNQLPEIDWLAIPKNSAPEKIRKRLARKSLPSEIKKVLFVSGLCDHDDSVFFSPLMSQIQLKDWYVRLLKFLKHSGFEIFWKPHRQDNALPSNDFLAEFGVNVVRNVVEDWYPKVDALLFDSFYTTPFFSGISSGRPLVFVDFGYEPFTEVARNLIAKRIAIVRAGFDPVNQRAELDWSVLSSALKEGCVRLADTGFQNSYILPGDQN